MRLDEIFFEQRRQPFPRVVYDFPILFNTFCHVFECMYVFRLPDERKKNVVEHNKLIFFKRVTFLNCLHRVKLKCADSLTLD